MDPTPLDEAELPEHILGRSLESLAAVDHEQDAAGEVEAALFEVVEQIAAHGLVLSRALAQPQNVLVPLVIDAERGALSPAIVADIGAGQELCRRLRQETG